MGTINRRDEKLDSMLGKKVQVTFWDKTKASGILHWNGAYNPIKGLHPFCYYIQRVDGGHLSFRKSHVTSVKEVKSE